MQLLQATAALEPQEGSTASGLTSAISEVSRPPCILTGVLSIRAGWHGF